MKSLKYSQIIIAGLISIFFFVSINTFAETDAVALKKDVERSIAKVSTKNIAVDVLENNTIVLRGEVSTIHERSRKHAAAAKVEGVEKISNQIFVKNKMVPAKMIEQNIKSDFRHTSHIKNPDRIVIRVNDNGIVYLDGKVKSEEEKKAAYDIASWHAGVKGIANNITVTDNLQSYNK